MRLLKIDGSGVLSFTGDLMPNEIPAYAILSHTWGKDEDEVTFNDMNSGSGDMKDGYEKIRFCSKQAQKDGLHHFWVDTCCIDKTNSVELQEAITSMFRWYRNAAQCYVYLSDVSARKHKLGQVMPCWKPAFRKSRWFTRGWTLQELVAPASVTFFSREGNRLGNKRELEPMIHETTGIPVAALRGSSLSDFDTEERMRWAASRSTKKEEDRAYCLMGIFGVSMPLIYGEGGPAAFKRLSDEISAGPWRFQNQLLESLNDGSPFTRSKNISACSEGTYAWVFGETTRRNNRIDENPSDYEDSDDESVEVQFDSELFDEESADSKRSTIRKWMCLGDRVLWIVGKPGSGKSALMKFMAGVDNRNQQTLHCLEDWAQPRKPRILSFYFWLADTSGLQNSFRGFLCHLVHQLLSNKSSPYTSNILWIDRYQHKRRMADWDIEELEHLFKCVASRIAEETPLCFFIDGLDECVPDDVDRVVKVVRELRAMSRSKMKFCVSSRPEQTLHNRLEALSPQKLELHRLTYYDIAKYVAGEFKACWKGAALPTREEQERFIREIVESSDGVFLWATLVTKKLCSGMEYGDSIGQLQRQLRELPRDMLGLYQNMLGRSSATEDRMAEAATYFRFVLDHSHGHPLYHGYGLLCTMSWSYSIVPFYLKYHPPTHHNDRHVKFERIQQRVKFLCAGMVDINELGFFHFFHRTARDFFDEPSSAKLLQHCTQLESYCLFVDGLLLGHDRGLCGKRLNLYFVRMMIRRASWIKESTERLKFLQYLDERMSRMYVNETGVSRRSWVYEEAKMGGHSDQGLDFVGLTVQEGVPELLNHHLSMGRPLSEKYQDYLLLCASRSSRNWPMQQQLLDLGANPNAIFCHGRKRRMKTSPWFQCLQSLFRLNKDERSLVQAFINNGASLEDRATVVLWVSRSMARFESIYQPLETWSDSEDGKHILLVVEVNAKFMLEKSTYYREPSTRRLEQLAATPHVQEATSYRRVLAMCPGNGHSPALGENNARIFAEIDCADSDTMLDEWNVFPIKGCTMFEEPLDRFPEALSIWERSPKIHDIEGFLEERGYCKREDDPAIPKGPISMYDDDDDD